MHRLCTYVYINFLIDKNCLIFFNKLCRHYQRKRLEQPLKTQGMKQKILQWVTLLSRCLQCSLCFSFFIFYLSAENIDYISYPIQHWNCNVQIIHGISNHNILLNLQMLGKILVLFWCCCVNDNKYSNTLCTNYPESSILNDNPAFSWQRRDVTSIGW